MHEERDTLRWPIRIPDLAEHYAAVLRFTVLAAGRADLERSFPLHRVQPATLELSRQSSLLLRRWEQNRAALERAGIQFGRARVAVRTAGAAQAGCVYCGLCMYGCPYGYIYNAADTVLQLQEHRSFSYQPDQVITSLEESASRVLIRGYHRTRRAPFEASADRSTSPAARPSEREHRTTPVRKLFILVCMKPRLLPGVK